MAWMQSQMEFPWTVVTGEGATLLHEGPWRLPPPACLGPWCAEQGRPGVDMRRLRSPEDSSLSSFCVPGTSPVTSTAPTLGSQRPMAGPREGLCGGLDAQPMRCTEDWLAVPLTVDSHPGRGCA